MDPPCPHVPGYPGTRYAYPHEMPTLCPPSTHRTHKSIPHACFRLSLNHESFPLPSREAPLALFRPQAQDESSHLRPTNHHTVLPSSDLRRRGETRRLRDDAEESVQDPWHSQVALCQTKQENIDIIVIVVGTPTPLSLPLSLSHSRRFCIITITTTTTTNITIITTTLSLPLREGPLS